MSMLRQVVSKVPSKRIAACSKLHTLSLPRTPIPIVAQKQSKQKTPDELQKYLENLPKMYRVDLIRAAIQCSKFVDPFTSDTSGKILSTLAQYGTAEVSHEDFML